MSKLKVEDLGKSYDGNVILENISFAAEPGDSIAFVSPSGSGKSTLLSMLGLLLSSTTGTVVVDGQDSDALGDKELSRLRRETFGFVFQHTQLVGSLRAVENVMAPANFAGKLPFDARERAEQLLGGLAGRLERKASGAVSPKRLGKVLARGGFDAEGGASLEVNGAPADISAAAAVDPGNRAWQSVQLARNVHRPTARAYIDAFVDGFIELHGDRSFGDDAAVVAGVGWIGGRAVTVIAQEKGADLKERIRRNFGCPQPEGYRKSLRLMRQAEKFGRPVVCLVDTQGADCRKQSGGDERSIERSLFNAQQLFRRLSVILVEARSAEFVVTIDGFSESVGIEAELLCQVFDGVGFEAVALRLKGIPLFLHFCCRLASRQVGTEAEGDTFRLKRSP